MAKKDQDVYDPKAEAKADQVELDAGAWSRVNGETDDRPLLRDVAFNRHSRNASGGWHHVSPLAHSSNDVGVDGIYVRLLQGLPPREEIAKVMSRAMNGTTGWDVSIGDSVTDPAWEDLLRGGLQAVMEAFVIVFEVSGVSRACTHQIVRSRRAGFHQQSQRATSYVSPEGVGPDVRIPESVWQAIGGGDPTGVAGGGEDELAYAWDQALMWSRRAYRLACEADVAYQDARYILPEGTENYIMCEYTLREFLAVYDYRACSMFNWEIVSVVRQMGELLKAQSPWIIGTGAEPRISCERTRHAIDDDGDRDGKLLGIGVGKPQAVAHACTFQGWEKVEGQCGFDWARESNRTFKPSRTI
jgi:flavin-dependent thymidylate synthase